MRTTDLIVQNFFPFFLGKHTGIQQGGAVFNHPPWIWHIRKAGCHTHVFFAHIMQPLPAIVIKAKNTQSIHLWQSLYFLFGYLIHSL